MLSPQPPVSKERALAVLGLPSGAGYEDVRRAYRRLAFENHPDRHEGRAEMAERFKLPIMTFIDTTGAYPGVGAEERGQSEAIARNLKVMSGLRTPIICTVIGEGGSGGALAIGVGDRILMLQYSTYSVISPEGCASILWKSADKAPLAAARHSIGQPRQRFPGLRSFDHRDPSSCGLLKIRDCSH